MNVSVVSNTLVGLCKLLEDKSRTVDIKFLSNCMYNVVAYNFHSLERLSYGTLQVIFNLQVMFNVNVQLLQVMFKVKGRLHKLCVSFRCCADEINQSSVTPKATRCN